MRLVFWVCVGGLVYVYVGYPLLVRIAAALAARPVRGADCEPTVSIVVAAYNEAHRIEQRLGNLADLDYPRDRLEILVGSDGSTDDTVARARAHVGAGGQVLAFDTRRGKPAVINELVAAARGDIVVFADVRQAFEKTMVRSLVRPFADPAVGAVSGELMLVDRGQGTVGSGVGFYWRYEKAIRTSEGRLDSTVGVTGAAYAIRRALYEPIAPDTLLDDVVVPMRIVRRGYRVVFEPGARAYDAVAASAREEFVRKVRTIAGTFQLFARERWIVNPLGNRLWVQTVSHKGLRLVAPLFLVGAFLASAALVEHPLYRAAYVAQVMFYVGAIAGMLRMAKGRGRSRSVLSVLYVFCLLHWATVVAFVRFLRRRQRVTWERAST